MLEKNPEDLMIVDALPDLRGYSRRELRAAVLAATIGKDEPLPTLEGRPECSLDAVALRYWGVVREEP